MRDLEDACPSRRAVLQGLAGAVLLPGVLVACSTGDEGGGPTDGTATSGDTAGGTVPASEIPPGTAKVVDVGGSPVVVAQPSSGEFVAFSASCTHQGTVVTAGDGLTLTCPNHGSQFNANDGSVVTGPATSPLPSVRVTQDGDTLVIG
jgi:Rieske Fe-S protein